MVIGRSDSFYLKKFLPFWGSLVLYQSSMIGHQHLLCLLKPKSAVKFTSLPVGFAVTANTIKIYSQRRVCSSYCCFKSPRLKRFSISCSIKDFVVSNDEKYGNKQVVSITPRLYDYILKHVPEPEILRQLREETASMRGSQMQVSPDQAQLLAMLAQVLGAERCIEVGVYTGYSSLAVALVLPDSGHLVACERDARSLEVAKKYYDLAGVSHKVNVKCGLAAETLTSLIMNGESCSYDFAFIDADKRMYQEYFEHLLQLVRVGGLIIFDNVLWHGRVADPLVNDAKTISIRNFNQQLLEDKRVSISMVPIGDGMTICRKR